MKNFKKKIEKIRKKIVERNFRRAGDKGIKKIERIQLENFACKIARDLTKQLGPALGPPMAFYIVRKVIALIPKNNDTHTNKNKRRQNEAI